MAAFAPPCLRSPEKKGGLLIPNQENTGKPSDNLQKLCHDESNSELFNLIIGAVGTFRSLAAGIIRLMELPEIK